MSKLSNGVTIGNGIYYVAWNQLKGVATIWVTPLEEPQFGCMHLVGENEKPLEFSSEPEAHAFLNGLKRENE